MRSMHHFALALSAGLIAVSSVVAQGKSTAPSAQVAPLVTNLHQVIQTLNAALHDYDGHRAAAVHETHKAIHALHPHHKLPAAPATTTAPTVKPALTKEDQKTSDAQLMAAMQQLQTLSTQIAANSSPHAPKAVTHVQAAMAELKIALSIK